MNFPDRRRVLAAAALLGASAAAARADDEPIIGNEGATILGPRNPPREQQDPDLLRQPATDHGTLPGHRRGPSTSRPATAMNPCVWMALTPHELVAAHLNINRDLLDGMRRDKQPVV